MKRVNCQANSYQRQQFLQFFNQLQILPPFREKFADRKFRQLLFFPVINAIQETKRGPWIIQILVIEYLMKDAYPFHSLPSFFTYSNKMNLDVIDYLSSCSRVFDSKNILCPKLFKSICKTTSFYSSKDQKRNYS